MIEEGREDVAGAGAKAADVGVVEDALVAATGAVEAVDRAVLDCALAKRSARFFGRYASWVSTGGDEFPRDGAGGMAELPSEGAVPWVFAGPARGNHSAGSGTVGGLRDAVSLGIW